jgi:glycolate oxidase
LSGGANAIEGCLVICTERMNRILDISEDGLTGRVQAGVVNAAFAAAARTHGLWYPPDPASWEWSTIGGNVATNAGGLCCVKYGVTRDALLELELVLATGQLVRIGRRTRKSVAGLDLVGLICGSEGTLGIVTEVTARLQLPPPAAHTLAASFPSLEGAGLAVQQIVRQTRPSLLELMDATTVAAVEEFSPMALDPDSVLIFARSDQPGDFGAKEIASIERLCQDAGASLVVTTDEEAEARMLMAARRLAYPALERKGAVLLDDVAVPLPAIAPLLAGIMEIAKRHGVLIGTFGHAGDGSMHPTIVYDADDADEVQRARTAFSAILDLALDLDGTITGEHGVGTLKRSWLPKELDGAHGLNLAVKRAFDPDGLLNPGKVY